VPPFTAPPACLGFILALLPLTLNAEMASVAWDNDLFTGKDRGYTNGVRLTYLTPEAETAKGAFARKARNNFRFLPGIGSTSSQHALTFSLRQLMVTPDNISSTEPQFDDTPYAGHLSLSSTLWSWNDSAITGFGAHIGVVGPESGAEASQRWVHKVTGSERPRGWKYQLGTDPVGGLHAAHGRKLLQAGRYGETEQQLSVIGSTLLSSFRTIAKAGLVWRIGHHLPVNFVPDYAGTSSTIALPGSLSESSSSWSVFAGLGVEYVAYSYLESNSGPYRFREGPFLGQLGVGATWQWHRNQIAMVLRAASDGQESSKDNFSFGTLSWSWAL